MQIRNQFAHCYGKDIVKVKVDATGESVKVTDVDHQILLESVKNGELKQVSFEKAFQDFDKCYNEIMSRLDAVDLMRAGSKIS